MGYSENCLPKSLAALGHDVHVLTSNWNVYGTSSDYDANYREFLGPADQGAREFSTDGYTVRRLRSRVVGGYVLPRGMLSQLRTLRPQVVQCTEIASLPCFVLAGVRPFVGFRLFAESHQHLSVVKPFMRDRHGNLGKRAAYRLTRTLPTWLASHAVERCYAVAPDCVEVAHEFFGVPKRKLKLNSLGTDTALFRPARTAEEKELRNSIRLRLGFSADDIVCIYTGRFTQDKNPALLARSIEGLAETPVKFRGLFVGQGPQRKEIEACKRSTIVPFVKHRELADLYRAADIAVWPRQESMSMLDAAATALPLIVSDRIGERERVTGSGLFYSENSEQSLLQSLSQLTCSAKRLELGLIGREKMEVGFSWRSIAKGLIRDYESALHR